jgi:hypothetical protein
MAPQAAPKDIGAMSPRELLHLFSYLGFLNSVKGAASAKTHVAPAKGPRGVRRRAKKARLRALHARQRRVSWCSFDEREKRWTARFWEAS